MTMEGSTPKKNQTSGLTGLADLLQRKYPGYSRAETFGLIKSVRKENGGKIVGLKIKQFFKIVKDIDRREMSKRKKRKEAEHLERLELVATCPFCLIRFVEKFSRDRHIINMHSKQHKVRIRKSVEKALECSTCRNTFYNEANLKRHLRLHEENPLDFPCDICGKKFTRKDNLFRHRERLHKLFNINFDAMQPDSKQLSFQCKMCSADFGASKDAFESHIVMEVCKKREKSVTVNIEGRIECDLCDKTFVEMSNLKRHINLKHSSRQQTNTCDKCDKTYTNISSLKRHVNTVHSPGDQTFCCESCGAEFTRRTSLVRHVKVLHKV